MKFKITPIETWSAANSFSEIEWTELNGATSEFVRVIGTATAEQAPDVINAIAKYRQKSTAFVVSNAVKIDGVADMAELAVSMEEVKTFDVMSYLMEQLDAEQAAVVKQLMSEGDEQLKEAA